MSFVVYQFTEENRLYRYRVLRNMTFEQAKVEARDMEDSQLSTFLVKNDIKWRDQCQELYTPVGNTMENRSTFKLDLERANLLAD